MANLRRTGLFHTRCNRVVPCLSPWHIPVDYFGKRNLAPQSADALHLCQACNTSDRGYPRIRSLIFEFPEDSTSRLIEDEYMFGSDLLVAPLFEKETERTVYLPPGDWIDYARHDKAEGTRWDTIPSRDIPIVVLVRAGAAIPHAGLAQSINDIDWNEIALRAFQSDKKQATAQFAAPAGALYQLNLSPRSDGEYHLENDSLMGKVRWQSKGTIK